MRLALGAELRRRREEARLSQDELAYRAGLHRTYLSDIERGVSSPSVDALEGVASALGLRVYELLRTAEEVRAD